MPDVPQISLEQLKQKVIDEIFICLTSHDNIQRSDYLATLSPILETLLKYSTEINNEKRLANLKNAKLLFDPDDSRLKEYISNNPKFALNLENS